MASQRLIVVDDADSRIQYSASWFKDDTGNQDNLGNFGPTLKSTLHGTNHTGSFQFEFNGTEISVLGTSKLQNSSGVINPSWECFIDNASIGSTAPFPYPENNWILCNTTNLMDSQHVLTVKAKSDGQTFWFDYLRYLPSEDVPLDDALIMVQSVDPMVQYDPFWEPLGNSANMTSIDGSQATFDFVGVSVAWYGMIPNELPRGPSLANYSINGSVARPFALTGLSSTSVSLYNQMFFETPILPLGRHNITVSYSGAQNSTPLTLDYLLIQNGSSTPSPPSPSTLSSPSSSSSSSSAAQSRKVNAAAVVGGVLSSLILIILIIFAILVILRRKRKRENDIASGIHIIEPFYPYPSNLQQRPETSTVARRNPFRGSVQRFANYVWTPPVVEPVAGPSRHSRSTSQRFSRLTGRSDTSNQERSYCGGHQTWAQIKAQEAAAAEVRRDSYI